MLEWIDKHLDALVALVALVVSAISGLLWLLYRLSRSVTVLETVQEENLKPRIEELSQRVERLNKKINDLKKQLDSLKNAQVLPQIPIETLPSRKMRKSQKRPVRTKKN